MSAVPIAAAVACTVAAWALGRRLNARFPVAWTNPVITATLVVVGALVLGGGSYHAYWQGGERIAAWLAPATAALGVPLYRHRRILLDYAPAIVTGAVLGTCATALVAVTLARLYALAGPVVASAGIKSATTPIAVQIAAMTGGDVRITAVFAIATGMTGALIGSAVLDACRVRDPVARGLGFGTISHGIGTVQANAEGSLQGAVSGVAMGIAAVLVSLAAPRLLPGIL